MKLLFLLFLICFSAVAEVPDIPKTMLFNVDAAHVCTPGYASKIRNVPDSIKHKICKPKTDCIVDHVISLELGGSNDISNLAAQTKADAHRKDLFENALHKRVCGVSAFPLDSAQHVIWMEWGHLEGKW